ncbi:serine/threonine-protein kinase RIO1 [Gracilaria domingensis]|nr:serine/threonine-protein kinase RIO1 [Gracilaria domingensis]
MKPAARVSPTRTGAQPPPVSSSIFRPFSTSTLLSSLQSTPTSPESVSSQRSQKPSNDQVPRLPDLHEPLFSSHPASDTRMSTPPILKPLPSKPSPTLSADCSALATSSQVRPSSQRCNSRLRRAHERLRAMTEDVFESDPMSLPGVFRADLGDDDSFTPEIVSGYLFNGPRARESNPTTMNTNPDSLHFNHVEEIPVQHPTHLSDQIDITHDLGDDDEYDGGQLVCDANAPEFSRSFSSNAALPANDPDHRLDAIYDDLDDIGGWVADTSSVGADLTKKLARALHAKVEPSQQKNTNIANTALVTHQRAEERRRDKQAKDKVDRATVEQVLDPKTRMILFKLLSRNRLRTLEGCVSTGKEANVYFATAASDPNASTDSSGSLPPIPGLLPHEFSPDAPVAVKVFKTSILQFKDRERYVAGEFRFRRTGYQRGSNRKMVQQWAEKEFRNQIRLQEAGIPAPIPLLLKPPVLIMSFFGKDGWPAPRLKDASLSPARLRKIYFRVCMIMRRMFRVAHLVHGDLSEYNMLYWKGDVVVIDVSQSVEDDHPMALDFLRRDCANVNDYFRRNGLASVLSVRELFDFVTGEHIGETKEEEENALGYLVESAANRDSESMLLFKRDDEVFMKSYIPRTLQEVEIREEQYRGREFENVDNRLFSKLTGLTIAQKRERPPARLMTKPLTRKNRTKLGETGAYEPTYSWNTNDDDHNAQISSTSLDAPCDEPATVRIRSTSDKSGLHISSPCTSNGSSRPAVDDSDAKVGARSNPSSDHSITLDAPNAYDLPQSSAGVVPDDEDDTFPVDEIENSGSSSSEWVRPAPQETPDTFMGLSRKEWKKRVKAENREKREHKVPKHVKKRKETLAKRRRHQK